MISGRKTPAILWLVLTASLLGDEVCRDTAFLGFDSRLSVRPAGRLPDGGDTPLAFEIVGGKPAVAFARELVILDGKQDLRLPLPFQATGILADGSATLIATSAGGVFEFGPSGWVRTDRFPAALAASLHNSGAPLPLVTLWDARTTGFLAFQTSASSFPIARIEGQLHAVSWNAGGLAAIVGDSLVIWRAGGNELRTLRTDTALAESRDICLLGEGRALVSARRGVYRSRPAIRSRCWAHLPGAGIRGKAVCFGRRQSHGLGSERRGTHRAAGGRSRVCSQVVGRSRGWFVREGREVSGGFANPGLPGSAFGHGIAAPVRLQVTGLCGIEQEGIGTMKKARGIGIFLACCGFLKPNLRMTISSRVADRHWRPRIIRQASQRLSRLSAWTTGGGRLTQSRRTPIPGTNSTTTQWNRSREPCRGLPRKPLIRDALQQVRRQMLSAPAADSTPPALGAGGSVSASQPHPTVSGHWSLISESGSKMRNPTTLAIEVDGPVVAVGGGGGQPQATYYTDGRPAVLSQFVLAPHAGAVMFWSLIFESSSATGIVKQSIEYSLSADGRKLTRHRKGTAPDGAVSDNTSIYSRD